MLLVFSQITPLAHAGSTGGIATTGNRVQQPVGLGVGTVCPMLAGSEGLDQLQMELFVACRGLVQTANLLYDNGGGTQFAIPGIDTIEQLNAALQQVGTEEFSVETNNLNQASGNRVEFKRMAALRQAARTSTMAEADVSRYDHYLASNIYELDARADAGAQLQADDEPGGLLSKPWGLYVNASAAFGEGDTTELQNGFDYTAPAVMVGFDRRIGTSWVAGASLSYQDFDADYDESLNVTGGDINSETLIGTVYGSYFTNKFYVDALIGYGQVDYDLTRRVVYPSTNVTATGDTDGDQLEIAAGAGYNGRVGRTQYTPFLRVSSFTIDIDGYTETGAGALNLLVGDQEIKSLLTSLGCQFAWTLGSGRGVFVPYARAEWYHEFEDDARFVSSQYAVDPFNTVWSVPGEDPDSDFFGVGGGFQHLWAGGTAVFVDLNAYLGLKNLDAFSVAAGGRFEF